MIYLFASTARDLYLQEVLDILALPYSAVYHFQYSEQYVVHELLQQDVQTNENYTESLKQYEGMDALIFLVDQSNLPEMHFYPLRKACIKKLELDGHILHVYFALGDYVNWRNPNVKVCDERVRGMLDDDQRPLGKYISITKDILAEYIAFANPENAPRAWQSIVDVINKEVFDYRNTIFYRIVGVREVTKSAYLDIQSLISYQTGYILESSKIYGMDLSFYNTKDMEKPIVGNKIVPLVDMAHFAFQPSEIEVIFRYDKRLVELVTKPLNQDSFTRIALSLQKVDQDPTQSQSLSDPPVRAPQISLLLKLTYPRFKFGLAFILLFIAQLMIATPNLTNSLTSSASSNIKVFITVFWLLGSSIYAVALFVLFRNLPGTSSSPR